MTKIIGLTGGIGSGKTTIANYFKGLGIPVYIADDEAKKIMENSEIIDTIREKFGDSIFENGKISREKLANIVFKNQKKLKELNEIIHPAVKKHFKDWLQQNATTPFIIKEAAILFESGSDKDCDQIITIVAPLETRIKRVIERDHITEEQVLSRIKNQWSDEMRISKSDYVIDNIDLAIAEQQVNKIAEKLTIQ